MSNIFSRTTSSQSFIKESSFGDVPSSNQFQKAVRPRRRTTGRFARADRCRSCLLDRWQSSTAVKSLPIPTATALPYPVRSSTVLLVYSSVHWCSYPASCAAFLSSPAPRASAASWTRRPNVCWRRTSSVCWSDRPLSRCQDNSKSGRTQHWIVLIALSFDSWNLTNFTGGLSRKSLDRKS